MVDKTTKEIIETIIEMTVKVGAGTGLEKGLFPETIATILEIKVQAIVGTSQDPEQVLTEMEYDVISVGNMIILQRTVPLLGKKREIEQLQQMLNLGNEQTSLTSLISNMQDNVSRTSSEENLRQEHLNL